VRTTNLRKEVAIAVRALRKPGCSGAKADRLNAALRS
jgi:hypothetical protein